MMNDGERSEGFEAEMDAEWERQEWDRIHGEAPPLSTSEQVSQWARAEGAESPETGWILSPFDTWERNPSYRGPEVPHPEDEEGWTMVSDAIGNGATREEALAAWDASRKQYQRASLRALGIDPQDPCLVPASDDDCPF
jgi:hypothetical protein